MNSPHSQNLRPLLLLLPLSLRLMPGDQRLPHLLDGESFKASGTHLGGNRNARIFYRCDVKRLTYPRLCQNIRGDQLIGGGIRHNAPFVHDHNPIHLPVKHVLQAMFNNHNGLVVLLVNAVYQIHSRFSGGGVEIRQRLVKQQQIHIVHHDTGKCHPLLLSTR